MCAWLLIWKAAKLKKPTNYLLYYSSLRKGIIGSFGHFKLLTYPPLPPPTSHFFGNKTVSLQLNYFLLMNQSNQYRKICGKKCSLRRRIHSPSPLRLGPFILLTLDFFNCCDPLEGEMYLQSVQLLNDGQISEL